MIVDSSSLAAIIVGEPDAPEHERLLRERGAKLSAPNYLELAVVVERGHSRTLRSSFDTLLADLNVTVVSFTPRQATIARRAYRDFGRGSGHPAKLNFGDCMSYALAIDTGEELLFKGDDFGHTDVSSARE